MIPPVRARELIEVGAARALAEVSSLQPYDPGKPSEIKVEFKNTTDPAKLAKRPGVEQVDPRTIVSRADDWWTAWRQFFF
jgi:D-aminopeptidase